MPLSQTKTINSVIPIFVVGYQHSGTTLLQNILRNNKSVFSTGGETKFFELLPMIRQTYPDLRNDNIFKDYIHFLIQDIRSGYRLKVKQNNLDASIAKALNNPEFDFLYQNLVNHRDHIQAFIGALNLYSNQEHKTHFLEKTPTHIYHLDLIFLHLPYARVVEIVRDPRDILASKKKRRQDIWNTNRYRPDQLSWKPYEKSFDPVWDSLSWKSAITAGLSAVKKNPNNMYQIRYEDLVERPESAVKQLCQFLDLPYSPEMLEIKDRNAADTESSKASPNQIASDAVGKYLKRLTPGEIYVCQRITEKELIHHSYSLHSVKLKPLSILTIYIKSMLEFIQRLYGRWRLGGYQYLRTVLINYSKRLKKLLPS